MKRTIKNTLGTWASRPRLFGKNKWEIAMLSLLLCCFAGCKDALDAPLEFDVVFSPADPSATFMQVDDTTFSATVGQVANFSFQGNADFITLKYNCFNEASATLTFDQEVNFYPNQDNLKLFISCAPLHLQNNNAKADSALISEHNWIPVDTITWAIEKNEKASTTIDMEKYRGESVILAFLYDTYTDSVRPENINSQPMFTISNLQMTYRTVKDTVVFKTVKASTMGFQPFDMLLMDDSISYLSTNPDEKVSGRWDCSFQNEDNTALIMRQGKVNKVLNKDWVFTNPIYISRGKDDEVKSVVIKNYYLTAEDYQFTLEEAGEYTLTFLATNANYKQNLRTTKTFKFIVHE